MELRAVWWSLGFGLVVALGYAGLDRVSYPPSSYMMLFTAIVVVLGTAIYIIKTGLWLTEVYPPTASRPDVRMVPFIALTEPDWSVLQKSIDAYRRETHHLLEQMSMSLEVVLDEESSSCPHGQQRFSDRLRAKIHRLAAIYESDLDVLQQHILVPFPVTYALPYAPTPLLHCAQNQSDQHAETHFTWGTSRPQRHDKLDRPYDSARQVVAHLVRDWSAHGETTIQTSTYGWCVQATLRYLGHGSHDGGPVLVPGAGLGRLAWELASKLGYRVEALESSVSMAAAAHFILHTGTLELHPYAADAFTNEINSHARYETVRFPDVKPALHQGSLSYTIAEFRYETMLHLRYAYSAIVTCFFVDTATTVYDYLTTIAMVLAPGGVWVNLGPLHWHFNSQVPVTVDELRLIIESFCDPTSGTPLFEILQWSVETRHVDYRNSGRSTRLEAYFPLRFVVRKAKNDYVQTLQLKPKKN